MYTEEDNEITNSPSATNISYLNRIRNKAALDNIKSVRPKKVRSKEKKLNIYLLPTIFST